MAKNTVPKNSEPSLRHCTLVVLSQSFNCISWCQRVLVSTEVFADKNRLTARVVHFPEIYY